MNIIESYHYRFWTRVVLNDVYINITGESHLGTLTKHGDHVSIVVEGKELFPDADRLHLFNIRPLTPCLFQIPWASDSGADATIILTEPWTDPDIDQEDC